MKMLMNIHIGTNPDPEPGSDIRISGYIFKFIFNFTGARARGNIDLNFESIEIAI